MPPFDDWNKIDDEEDVELQDDSFFDGKRDVILFCIDCSESMHALRDDPTFENVQTSHLLSTLDAAMQIQKKKAIVGPNDSVGILLFNTTRPNEVKGYASEIKKNCFVYQQIAPMCASTIQELIFLIDEAREDPGLLRNTFPPVQGKKIPMGDVFTSCNWLIRDGAPKTASKRVFLITDDDNPHPNNKQLLTSSKTTLIDLTQAGVQIEPFFISTPEAPFDPTAFYSTVLPSNTLGEDEDEEDSGILPASQSIARIDDLLSQMRFREVPKRALFNIPFELGKGFVIGIKGYGLVTEQKRGTHKYFVDLGHRMEVASSRAAYHDEDRQVEIDRNRVLFGGKLGSGTEAAAEGDSEEMNVSAARAVKPGQRPFYTADEVRSFRTLDLEPGLKLLGFKNKSEIALEDNIKHALFVYPDELKYSGSKRTFSALLQKMLEKDKIGLVLALVRSNATPAFCALVPQAEKVEEGGWSEPSGFHLIFLPFADDIRAAPITEAFRAGEEAKDAARAWIDKLCVKNGAYAPDSYPNPALAYHNAQLQASAFREEFNPEAFEDLTRPKYDIIHKRAGALLSQWKKVLARDENYNVVVATTGSKRKADVSVDEADLRSKYAAGTLDKLRVDQLKEVLKSKGLPTSGKKSDLIERVGEWLNKR